MIDADTDVVVCCGSGGVGKTTVAAAIALDQATRGQRVVVVTIDPARRLADALGLPGGLTGEPQQIDIACAGDGELWAMMLDSPAMFERVIRRHAADDDQANRIVSNRFYRNIANALSGTHEYMASEALYELHDDGRFDLVVVDTPPSRHALDFLEAPGVLARFLDHPVFKLMMLPTRTGLKVLSVASQPILKSIGRVVGSDVLADASAFFQAFAGMEAGFRQRAEAVAALLHAGSTRFVLVASPRSDTIGEAAWLADQLTARRFGVGAVVANRVYPRFGTGTVADARRRAGDASAAGKPDLAALWENLARSREIADAERVALQALADRSDADLTTIPLLDADVHDLAGLQAIAGYLA